MNVHDMLSHDSHAEAPYGELPRYRTRHSLGTIPVGRKVDQSKNDDAKNITFELLFTEDSRFRARLPMKVQIWPHDSTENIVSAVRNFFGLYDNAIKGVNFEDSHGNTLIASHENLAIDMTVYVRIVTEGPNPYLASPLRAPVLDHSIPEPALSRPMRRNSSSPRSSHAQQFPKKGLRLANTRGRDSLSFQARLEELNSEHSKHGSSDGEEASVSSSFKARNELLASAEISVENIVAGGRRQRAKFESSELPLFVPPQVPAANSISSMSPQRRATGADVSPFVYQPHGNYARNHPWPSPMQSATGMTVSSSEGRTSAPHNHRLRGRISGPPSLSRNAIPSRGLGLGILPTPDPTVASTISDEDVALQLMRLADASTISHGRASASTLDETMSGRADHASSDSEAGGLSNESQGTRAGGRQSKKHKRQRSLQDHKLYVESYAPKRMKHEGGDKKSAKTTKAKHSTPAKRSHHVGNAHHGTPTYPEAPAFAMGPPSASVTGDDDDLSSKPRCQRCRKSKKGCDRQRPCQRCKDAGIGIDGCISEDENNGRKGRFGRHMGVSVNKDFVAEYESEPLQVRAQSAESLKRRKR